MTDQLHVQVITPLGVVYDSLADQISVTTMNGELTILPHHIPLVAPIVAGELRIVKDGVTLPFAIDTGVVQVEPDNRITLLVESSENVEGMDEVEIQQAIDRAAAAMADTANVLDVDFARFQSMMERDMNKLRVARKWRK